MPSSTNVEATLHKALGQSLARSNDPSSRLNLLSAALERCQTHVNALQALFALCPALPDVDAEEDNKDDSMPVTVSDAAFITALEQRTSAYWGGLDEHTNFSRIHRATRLRSALIGDKALLLNGVGRFTEFCPVI